MVRSYNNESCPYIGIVFLYVRNIKRGNNSMNVLWILMQYRA